MKKFKIKKGDTVYVNSGNDKGKTGKVLSVLTEKDRVIVEGVNLVSKHTKPNSKQPQGGIIKQEAAIHISNVNLLDPSSTASKAVPTRVGYKVVDGKKVDTPPKEMELLYHLASSPNRVFTRNQLLDEVWGFDYFGDSRTVDVHVKRLREKLEGVSDKWSLKTVWGVGYKFELLD